MKTKKMFLKLMALICVMIMFITLISGCSDKGNEATDNKASEEGTETNKPEAEEKSNPYEKHLKFSMSAIGADKSTVKPDGTLTDNFKWLCDKFNVEFEFWPLTWSNYIEETRLWLASGDLPDLIMLDVAPTRYGEFLSWVQQGLIKPYPDDVFERYPNMKLAMDKMTVGGQKFIVDGKLYAWPGFADTSQYNYLQNNQPVYRRDWARQVGMLNENDEYTWDEWTALVKEVVQQDLAGGNKTVGMVGVDWTFPKYFGAGTISPYMLDYVKKDGKWVWGPTLPESLEAVKLMKQIYDEGIIYKDQVMIKNDIPGNLMNGGLAFAYIPGNSGAGTINSVAVNIQKVVPGFDPANDLGYAYFKGPNGKIYSNQSPDHWTQTALNPKISDEKVERWCAITDYLLTDEGYYYIGFGIPGKDWTLENGQIKVNWPKDESGKYIAPTLSGFSRAVRNIDALQLMMPHIPEWARNKTKAGYERMLQPDVNPKLINVDQAYYTGPNYAKIGNKEREIYQEVANLMLSENVEADWNAWVKAKLPEVEPALKELNENVK